VEGAVVRRDVGRPVLFRRGAVPIDGVLDHVRLYLEPGGARVLVAVVHLDFFVFQRVEDFAAFGLTRESIDPRITEWEFGSDQPVVMELRLEGPARAALDRFTGTDELLDAYVREVTDDANESPLTDADSYRYLSALQPQRVGTSTALVGFRSIYVGPSGTR
jgi:hypothetical protein